MLSHRPSVMANSMSPLVANESPHLGCAPKPARESLIEPVDDAADGWRCGRSEPQVLFFGRPPSFDLASRMR